MSRLGQDNIIVATVESIDDPTFSGRIKARVKGFHDNMTTAQLPWCTYGGCISIWWWFYIYS